MPNHRVWIELERFFKAKLAQAERQQIVHVVQQALQQHPEQDLNDLVLQVTNAVLSRRRQQASR